MKKQFPLVNSQYGAPMGRRDYGFNAIDDAPAKSVRLFKVNLDSGGYDDGGAYWGHGQAIYCAICDVEGVEFRVTVRANNRFHAAALLEIKPSKLKVKLTIPGAYGVRLEYCGQPSPRYVVRLWNDWLSSHETEEAAVIAAMTHYTSKRAQS